MRDFAHTSRSDFVFTRAPIDDGRLSDDRGKAATSPDSGNCPSAAKATIAPLTRSGASVAGGEAMVTVGSQARVAMPYRDWDCSVWREVSVCCRCWRFVTDSG